MTKLKYNLILAILTIFLIAATAGCVQKSEISTLNQTISPVSPIKELTLSDFPELFRENTVIVIGENATKIELECAYEIANYLGSLTGNMSPIKNDDEIVGNEKVRTNLILVGNPDTNKAIRDVFEQANATKMTEEYTGAGQGILEILRNPWNEETVILLVTGSNAHGVMAGSKLLKYVKELDKDKVIVDFGNLTKNKQAFLLGLTLNEFENLEMEIYEYLYEKYPFLNATMFGIRYEKVNAVIKDIPPDSLVIDAYANFRTPPVVLRIAFFNGNFQIISEIEIKEDT